MILAGGIFMDTIKTGALLKSLRVSKGLTQQQVADQLFLSPKTISKWENGDGLPDITIISSVAALYGVTVDELLNGKVSKEVTIKKTAQLQTGMTLRLIQKCQKYLFTGMAIHGIGTLISLSFFYLGYRFLGLMLALIFLVASIIIAKFGHMNYKSTATFEQDEHLLLAYQASKKQVRLEILTYSLVSYVLYIIGFYLQLAMDIDGLFNGEYEYAMVLAVIFEVLLVGFIFYRLHQLIKKDAPKVGYFKLFISISALLTLYVFAFSYSIYPTDSGQAFNILFYYWLTYLDQASTYRVISLVITLVILLSHMLILRFKQLFYLLPVLNIAAFIGAYIMPKDLLNVTQFDGGYYVYHTPLLFIYGGCFIVLFILLIKTRPNMKENSNP
jgi:transcriptional regulator with XRE-family HTH domain